MKQLEAVIFDWAGTTVDYGCMAPIHAMKEAFKAHHLMITIDEIRKPMGLLKLDHIKAVLDMDRVQNEFHQIHGRHSESHDIEKIYSQFEQQIFSILDQHTKVIDGVLTIQDYLRSQNIKIGSTTGYTKDMINIVASSAKVQGYDPHFVISADQVSHGRPYPYMLQENFAALQVKNVKSVIKVGDTIVDILEGLNAGCWSIGVIKGSSMLGLGEKEIANLPEHDLKQKMRQIKYQMLAAGAHYVIETIDELPWVIDLIQQKQ